MNKSFATFLLFFASCIWGLSFVAQRTGMDYVGAFTFNAMRFLLGALSLVPVALLFERKAQTPSASVEPDAHARRIRQTAKAGLLTGLVLFIAAGLQQWGVEITLSAGKAGFITGLYIVITPLLGLALGKKTGLSVWLGALIACGGLYLLSVPSGLASVGMGDIALMIGAVFWAVHILVVDYFAGVIYPVRFSIMQFLVCAALSWVCAFIFEDIRIEALLAGYSPILYSGLLSVGVAYTLQIIGQRQVEPAKAALIFSTESLFSALGAALLLHEILSPRAYLGGALIFVGVLASQLKFKKRPVDLR